MLHGEEEDQDISQGSMTRSRRKRFPYVNKTSGNWEFEDNTILIINSIASCFYLPILFFLAVYFLVIAQDTNTNTNAIIACMFVLIAFIWVYNFFIGYAYDKMAKNQSENTKSALTIIGTIGFIGSAYIFFNTSPAFSTSMFWSMIGLSLFFPLANLNHYKNSANYTPIQQDRCKLFYTEFIIQIMFLIAMILTPVISTLLAGGCVCAGQCVEAGSPECLTCYQTCDSGYITYSHLQAECFWFLVLAGVANIILNFAMKPRADETFEVIPSTFNNRYLESNENLFQMKIRYTALLEFFMLFALGIWFAYLLAIQMQVNSECLEQNMGGLFGGYACTRGFLLIIGAIILLGAAIAMRTLASSVGFMITFWVFIPLLFLAFGLILIFNNPTAGWQVIIVGIIIAILFCTAPTTKLLFSDSIFYDEYVNGVPEPYLPSSNYLLSILTGFYLGISFAFFFIEPVYVAGIVAPSTLGAILLIVVSCILFGLKVWTNQYELKEFDKIHIAIERNVRTNRNDVTFVDPIGQEEIKRPLVSLAVYHKELIATIRDLNIFDQVFVLTGHYDSLIIGSICGLIFVFIFFGFDFYFAVIRWNLLYSHSVWWLFLCYILMPGLIFTMLASYFSIKAVIKLKETNLMGANQETLEKIVNSLNRREFQLTPLFQVLGR